MKKLFAIIVSFHLIALPIPAAHAADSGGMAKMVFGMANGIIGSTILTKCKLGTTQPSLPTYMAGSIIYVVAEIASGKDKSSSVKDNAKKLDELKGTMVEGGDYQRAAVQAQLDDEKSTLKHIQKKRSFMMATKVVYTAATALAAIEFILSKVPPFKPDVAACGPDMSHIGSHSAIAVAYSAFNGFGSGGMMGAAMGAASPFVMTKVMSVVGVGTTAVNGVVSVLSLAPGRIAAFGAATALVMMIDGGLAKAENDSKKKIADLEKVLGTFDSSNGIGTSIAKNPNGTDPSTPNQDGAVATSTSANGTAGAVSTSGNSDSRNGTSVASSSQNGNQTSGAGSPVNQLPTGTDSTMAKTCISSKADGSLDFSSASCSQPLTMVRGTLPLEHSIPTLQAASNLGTEMAQALARGDTAKANIAAGELASMAAKVSEIHADSIKKANVQLVAEGTKPIDINDHLNAQIAAMNQALNKQQPGSGNYKLADLTHDTSNVALTAAEMDKQKELETSQAATAAAAAALKSIKGDSAVSEGNINGAGTSANPEAGRDIASVNENGEKSGATDKEISQDHTVTLFQQVSNRYIQSLPKILKKKELTPVQSPH